MRSVTFLGVMLGVALVLTQSVYGQNETQLERRQIELEQIALVRSLYRAWNNGDFETLLAAFEEEGRWRESRVLPFGGTATGAASIREEVLDHLEDEWQGWTIALDHVLANGPDNVTAFGTVTAFNRETGRSLWSPYVGTWMFRNGLVRTYVGYLDADVFWRSARLP